LAGLARERLLIVKGFLAHSSEIIRDQILSAMGHGETFPVRVYRPLRIRNRTSAKRALEGEPLMPRCPQLGFSDRTTYVNKIDGDRTGGNAMQVDETKGTFGFHLRGGRGDPPAAKANVQRSSALSRSADLAISPHLTSESEIDRFIDEAIASLQTIRVDAKNALTAAKPS
jgi:hypothetical protein